MYKINIAVAAMISTLAIHSAVRSQTIIDFRDNGNFQAASISEGGVLVTGSNLLNVSGGSFGGIGVVGDDDNFVDDLESLIFEAEGGVRFTSFRVETFLNNSFGNDEVDDFRVEGFDSSGNSLGVFDSFGAANIGDLEYVSTLGVSEVHRFEVASVGDSYIASRIRVGFTAVPEPTSAILLLAGGIGLAVSRRRK